MLCKKILCHLTVVTDPYNWIQPSIDKNSVNYDVDNKDINIIRQNMAIFISNAVT